MACEEKETIWTGDRYDGRRLLSASGNSISRQQVTVCGWAEKMGSDHIFSIEKPRSRCSERTRPRIQPWLIDLRDLALSPGLACVRSHQQKQLYEYAVYREVGVSVTA